MNISNSGKELIKRFEGLRTSAYLDSAGIWTIGFGHTGAAGAPDVQRGDVISYDEAHEIFDRDIKKFEKAVNNHVIAELNQNQFDALVSFVFNVGEGNFSRSTLLRLLNGRDYARAAQEFTRWVYADGKKLGGLEKRRLEEKRLFEKPMRVQSPTQFGWLEKLIRAIFGGRLL